MVTTIGSNALNCLNLKKIFTTLNIQPDDYGSPYTVSIVRSQEASSSDTKETKPPITCTISFNANGGTLSGDATQVMTYGEAFKFTQTATRTGCTFDGWYTEKGTQMTSGQISTFTSDTPLIAH